MRFIKESHDGERYLMAVITICDEFMERENLEGWRAPCYKGIACPGESRAPLQRGVASAAGGCCGAVVKTGFGPGRAGIVRNVQARPLPIG